MDDTLFDPENPPQSAREAADAAIDTARQHAPADWLARAEKAVLMTAQDRETFTTDDVWLGEHTLDTLGEAFEPRALGAVMRDLHRRGLIEPTDDYVPSCRRECHARPIRVWRQA
jgi:hypothetical protein